MADKKLIKPIKFIKFNQCPNCLGDMIFREVEIYESVLDENGIPGKGVTYVEPRLVCPRCGREYDCEKIGMMYKIDYHLPKVRPVVKSNNPFYK